MWRRSVTTGAIIKASRVLKETFDVLSEPERGAVMKALGTASRMVASCKKRTTELRSELVIVPLGLVDETNSSVTSYGQGYHQTRLRPVMARSIHVPPAPSPDASQNPRWVGF